LVVTTFEVAEVLFFQGMIFLNILILRSAGKIRESYVVSKELKRIKDIEERLCLVLA